MSEMFFEINKLLCDTYNGLDPLKLLDYPAEDVIDLINHTIKYYKRKNNRNQPNSKANVTYKPAGDNWF